jgi:hypothetical protein
MNSYEQVVEHGANVAQETNMLHKSAFFYGLASGCPKLSLDISSAILTKKYGGKGKLPAAVKRAFAKALEEFNEPILYGLALHNSQVSVYDLVNLVHPRKTQAIRNLMNKTLRAA